MVFLGLYVTYDSDAIAKPTFFRDQVEKVALFRLRVVDLIGFTEPTYGSVVTISVRVVVKSSICY